METLKQVRSLIDEYEYLLDEEGPHSGDTLKTKRLLFETMIGFLFEEGFISEDCESKKDAGRFSNN